VKNGAVKARPDEVAMLEPDIGFKFQDAHT